MAEQDLAKLRSKEGLAEYAGRPLENMSHMGGMGHGHDMGHMGHGDGPPVSVRETEYKNHHLVVRTTYEFQVDGKPVKVDLNLDNDGNVTCHALPNYNFISAVELLKKLVDQFPKAFEV